MDKNGTKKELTPFKENKRAAIKAASITDHHGIKNDKISAKTKVAIKLRPLVFIYSEIKVCVAITASVFISDCI